MAIAVAANGVVRVRPGAMAGSAVISGAVPAVPVVTARAAGVPPGMIGVVRVAMIVGTTVAVSRNDAKLRPRCLRSSPCSSRMSAAWSPWRGK